MRTVLRISLRSLSWRRWATLGLLAAAVAAFASAAVGPLWANAAEDSLLTQTFGSRAGTEGVALVQVTARGNDRGYGKKQIPQLAEQEARQAGHMPPALARAFTEPRRLLATSGRLLVRPAETDDEPAAEQEQNSASGAELMAHASWSRQGCIRTSIVAGSCPGEDSEVVVSVRTARTLGVQVGDEVVVPILSDEPPAAGSGEPFPSVLRVSGVYRPPDVTARGWVGWELVFEHAPGDPDAREPVLPRTETLFTTAELLRRLSGVPVVARETRLLALQTADADSVDQVAARLQRWDNQRRALTGSVSVVDEPLAAVTAVVDQRAAVRLASWMIGLQLLGLVWFVLYLLTAAATEGRSHDVALAKLRGLRPRTVTLLAVLEPVIVVLVALPLGLLLAVGLVSSASAQLLPGQVGLRLDDSVLTAVVLALSGSCLAAVAAVRSTVRERALVQLSGGRRTWTPRGLILGEVVVVTLCAAALWQVFGRRDDSALEGLVLLAPGLAAAGVGVLAARALRTGSLLLARRTRHRPRHPAYLASRQVGRRQHGTRVAVFAAVAVSLAVFATASWGVGERQRAGQAAMGVGAHVVLEVAAASPADLVRAVDRLDPTGRRLLAAVELDSTNPAARVLAVDSPRLAATSAWQRTWGLPRTEVTRRLRPEVAPTLRVRGPKLSVAVDIRAPVAVTLLARLVDDQGVEHRGTAALPGDGPMVADMEIRGCRAGCRLEGFTLVRQPGETGLLVGQVTFTGLVDAGHEVPGAFAASDWRPTRLNARLASSTQTARIEAVGSDGLRAEYNVGPTEVPGIERADVPEALPVVVSPTTVLPALGRDELVQAVMLDGVRAPAVVAGRSHVLPRLEGVGALADLRTALRLSGPPLPTLGLQVWASPRAESLPVLTRQLARQDVRVVASSSIAERRAALDRSGPALALLLLLGVAGAALVVAVLAVAGLALVHGRARAVETAALRTAGVRSTVLRKAASWEYAMQLSTGVVAGMVAGVVTAAGLAASVSRIGLAGPVAPVRDGLPTWWVMAAVLGTAVVFVLLSTACARVTVVAARPERVRELGA